MNPDIKKNVAKVVDSFDVEDIADKSAFCRCWRSKKVNIPEINLFRIFHLNYDALLITLIYVGKMKSSRPGQQPM